MYAPGAPWFARALETRVETTCSELPVRANLKSTVVSDSVGIHDREAAGQHTPSLALPLRAVWLTSDLLTGHPNLGLPKSDL